MDLFFAVAPIALLIYLMAKPQGMPSQRALPLVALLMYFIKLVYFADDPNLIHATVVQGLLSALIPFSIVAGAILLFKTMEASGAMNTIRDWLNSVSNHEIAQLMIIGWAFSFMIEGASGFGTPAALAAPILVSLRFPAFKVAIFCLMMNSVPVSFGAVGTPTWYGFGALLETMDAAARERFLMEVGYKSVIMHGVASLLIPLLGLIIVVGWQKVRANLLFVYLSVASCVVPYALLALVSYEFPALIGGMIGFALSILFASLGIGLEKTDSRQKVPINLTLIKALFPLWGTVLVLVITRIPQFGIKARLTSLSGGFSQTLGSLGDLSISQWLVLHLNNIFCTQVSWSFQLLYVPALIPFVLISGLTFLLFRMQVSQLQSVLRETGSRLINPLFALLGALVCVRLIMLGGEQASAEILGRALADAVGANWQMFAAYLGALGSFFSGSATVSNLTFGGIQFAIAQNLGLQPTTILALQSVGGSMGNMVCIHNIVAICSILGIAKEEGRILRWNTLPMLMYGAIAGIVAVLFF